MFWFSLFLIINTALAFNVKIKGNKCYVEAKKGNTNDKIWIDMSKYLDEESMILAVVTNCKEYVPVSSESVKKSSDSVEHTVCEHEMGFSNQKSASPYFNGHHFTLFFNFSF